MDEKILIDVLVQLADREEELAGLTVASAQSRLAETEINEEIVRLLALLPDGISRLLIRLRTKHPRSVARLHGGACDGCFCQLPPQQSAAVARGKTLVRCPSCSRPVVRQAWN